MDIDLPFIHCRMCARHGTIRRAAWVFNSDTVKDYTLCGTHAVAIGVQERLSTDVRWRRITIHERDTGQLEVHAT